MTKDEINKLIDEYKEFTMTGKEKEWRIQPDIAIALMNISTKRAIADAINNLADAIREKK